MAESSRSGATHDSAGTMQNDAELNREAARLVMAGLGATMGLLAVAAGSGWVCVPLGALLFYCVWRWGHEADGVALWQWENHRCPSAAEPQPPPEKPLAEELWNRCPGCGGPGSGVPVPLAEIFITGGRPVPWCSACRARIEAERESRGNR